MKLLLCMFPVIALASICVIFLYVPDTGSTTKLVIVTLFAIGATMVLFIATGPRILPIRRRIPPDSFPAETLPNSDNRPLVHTSPTISGIHGKHPYYASVIYLGSHDTHQESDILKP